MTTVLFTPVRVKDVQLSASAASTAPVTKKRETSEPNVKTEENMVGGRAGMSAACHHLYPDAHSKSDRALHKMTSVPMLATYWHSAKIYVHLHEGCFTARPVPEKGGMERRRSLGAISKMCLAAQGSSRSCGACRLWVLRNGGRFKVLIEPRRFARVMRSRCASSQTFNFAMLLHIESKNELLRLKSTGKLTGYGCSGRLHAVSHYSQ